MHAPPCAPRASRLPQFLTPKQRRRFSASHISPQELKAHWHAHPCVPDSWYTRRITAAARFGCSILAITEAQRLGAAVAMRARGIRKMRLARPAMPLPVHVYTPCVHPRFMFMHTHVREERERGLPHLHTTPTLPGELPSPSHCAPPLPHPHPRRGMVQVQVCDPSHPHGRGRERARHACVRSVHRGLTRWPPPWWRPSCRPPRPRPQAAGPA